MDRYAPNMPTVRERLLQSHFGHRTARSTAITSASFRAHGDAILHTPRGRDIECISFAPSAIFSRSGASDKARAVQPPSQLLSDREFRSPTVLCHSRPAVQLDRTFRKRFIGRLA